MHKILKNIYIYKIGYGGIGLASLPDGKKIIIKGGALPKSVVDIKIVKNKKDYMEGHIIETTKYDKSIADGKVFCPHYYSPIGASEQNQNSHKIGCGGCKWQIISYLNQLKLKQEILEDGFSKIKKIKPDLELLPIVGSPTEKGYRNKIEFSFGVYISERQNINERWNLGFHKQGEFAKIVDIDSCGLISDKANKLFEYLKKLCFESGLETYDQKRQVGIFRHLVIREGVNTNQILINLSICNTDLKEEKLHKRNHFLEHIQKDETLKTQIDSFVITYNNGLADTVRSQISETKVLRGDGYIYEKMFIKKNIKDDEYSTNDGGNNYIEATFRVSPFSFFQTNTLGAQDLFAYANHMIGHTKGTILDLYCGTGTIGLNFLKLGKGDKLIGVEIVEDAIIDARENAKINGLDKESSFYADASEKILNNNQGLKSQIENLGLVIIDPPRDGLHKNVIEFLSDLKKEKDFKLLYISCNPITMARDIELLLQNGFNINKLQGVDMFPQTHHIEVIGVLY